MDKPDEVGDAELETLAAFRYALRRFLHFSEEAARQVGLTPQQHQALLSVRGLGARGPVTVGALAEHLQVRHHSAVGLVDRLVQRGLVERQTGSADRRQVHLSLTGEGEGLLMRLSSAHRDELQRIGPEISRLLARLMG
jgi:DNA-binding MarR family transcriptional regulator